MDNKKESAGGSQVISLLNRALSDELEAIHQYLYFHFHCEDQGLDRLASIFKDAALGEMRHVEKLAQRILFLKGELGMSVVNPVKPIRDARAMLAEASIMEEQSAASYNAWANDCGQLKDLGTRHVFESLTRDEENHLDNYRKELENLAKFGDQYLALQTLGQKVN